MLTFGDSLSQLSGRNRLNVKFLNAKKGSELFWNGVARAVMMEREQWSFQQEGPAAEPLPETGT